MQNRQEFNSRGDFYFFYSINYINFNSSFQNMLSLENSLSLNSASVNLDFLFHFLRLNIKDDIKKKKRKKT